MKPAPIRLYFDGPLRVFSTEPFQVAFRTPAEISKVMPGVSSAHFAGRKSTACSLPKTTGFAAIAGPRRCDREPNARGRGGRAVAISRESRV